MVLQFEFVVKRKKNGHRASQQENRNCTGCEQDILNVKVGRYAYLCITRTVKSSYPDVLRYALANNPTHARTAERRGVAVG